MWLRRAAPPPPPELNAEPAGYVYTITEGFDGKFTATKRYEVGGRAYYTMPSISMGPYGDMETAKRALDYLRTGPKEHVRITQEAQS